MSQKKHPQYLAKTSSTSSEGASAVPPRYQPPPNVTSGILKHSQHPPQVQSVAPNKDTNGKQLQVQGMQGLSKQPTLEHGNLVKGGPSLLDHAKFYPNQHQHQQAAGGTVPKPYLGYPYTDIRSQPQLLQQQATDLQQQLRRYTTTDDDFLRNDGAGMLKFVRKSDLDQNNAPRLPSTESTRHLQGLMSELRILKEVNQRLADDNQELRDLCCFLDDDRQKGRKLAREWQRFGRYTASVMRQEVSAYQSKLRELDNKQQELIKDNLELKELCLYLDEERGGAGMCPACGGNSTAGGALRDDGDGSSSSTNADEPHHQSAGFNTANTGGSAGPGPGSGPNSGTATSTAPPRRTTSRERLLYENLARQRTTFNDQTMQYVRSLEQRVKQLEDEKHSLQHKLKGSGLTEIEPPTSTSSSSALSGRPEAVVRALQVLEVREQLERDGRCPPERLPTTGDHDQEDLTSPDMDDGEKALVREMCNVVWRKLEEVPQQRR